MYGLKDPAAQSKHTLAPLTGLYLPATHGAHKAVRVELAYFPTAQEIQALELEAPERGLYFPISQSTQSAGALAYVPAGQVLAVKEQVGAPL